MLLATITACGPYSSMPNPPKPELRDGTVQHVMSYLHAKDADGLESLALDGFVGVEQDVSRWIATWGGVQDSGYQVFYESPGGTTYYHTTIDAKALDGSLAQIQISLSWEEDHWAVGPLGRPASPPTGQPANPSTPAPSDPKVVDSPSQGSAANGRLH